MPGMRFLHCGWRSDWSSCGSIGCGEYSGEKTAQPGALQRGEWGGVGERGETHGQSLYFNGLLFDDRPQLLGGMASHEIGERFIFAGTGSDITAQKRFDNAWNIAGGNIAEKL